MILIAAGLSLAAAVLICYTSHLIMAAPGEQPPERCREATSVSQSRSLTNGAGGAVAVPENVNEVGAGWNGESALVAALEALRQVSGREDARQTLVEAFSALRTLPPERAVRELLQLLDSGEDASTGLNFRVGLKGTLKEAPTLRVAALDWLGEMAPQKATEYARRIFESSSSPDEWAVALRNYGRTTAAREDPMFRNAVRSLITRKEWQVAPTQGYAEAFDAAVFLADADTIPDIVEGGKASKEMARLAPAVLDNFVMAEPGRILPYLQGHYDLLQGTPKLRAQLMARTDVREPVQRRSVEDYLLRNDISEGERKEFAQLYPHFSRVVGLRLLTTDRPMPLSDQAAIDVASLDAVRDWKGNHRFDGVSPWLTVMERRLEGHVQSARRAGMTVGNGTQPLTH